MFGRAAITLGIGPRSSYYLTAVIVITIIYCCCCCRRRHHHHYRAICCSVQILFVVVVLKETFSFTSARSLKIKDKGMACFSVRAEQRLLLTQGTAGLLPFVAVAGLAALLCYVLSATVLRSLDVVGAPRSAVSVVATFTTRQQHTPSTKHELNSLRPGLAGKSEIFNTAVNI